MKAVILPTAKTEDLAPLTTWMPEFLLPVVNKPVVEHLIELLVRHGVKEILLVLKHMPYETEQYFGDGSRWGVRLSYSLLTRYRGIADALGRTESSRLEGPLICLPGDLVTDLDLCGFMDARCRGPGSIVSARPVARSSDPGLSGASAGEAQGPDACPLFISEEALPSVSALGIPGTPGSPGEGVSVYPVTCGYERIRSPADLVRVNRRVIEGGFKGILLPGREIEPGIWVGRHCRIHPRARLEAPVLIGSHCDIQAGSVVGPGSVVGDHVIVDEGASVQESVVLDRTYVGVHTRIHDALVRKNWMLQTPTMLEVYLVYFMIMADPEKGTLSTQ
ncbi:MAG TPA: NDP-sugar synthase, partial [Syntrophobacteraceae bacterium]|nr:NDP-sugar synthase [Syntrophobacteraceae bacterium]